MKRPSIAFTMIGEVIIRFEKIARDEQSSTTPAKIVEVVTKI